MALHPGGHTMGRPTNPRGIQANAPAEDTGGDVDLLGMIANLIGEGGTGTPVEDFGGATVTGGSPEALLAPQADVPLAPQVLQGPTDLPISMEGIGPPAGQEVIPPGLLEILFQQILEAGNSQPLGQARLGI